MVDTVCDLILIVDDNPTNLEVLSKSISSTGYSIAVATSGENALKQIGYERPSLILLDVMMPGIDGFETCRRLKADPTTSAIPVIFMTALSDIENKIKGLSLGAVDYITKPFQQEEVIARIKIHLKIQTLTQTLACQNELLRQEIQHREQAEAQLQLLNHELEVRVANRTAELSTALHQLQQTQVQLVQKEKLSTLGELVAGVAHEINNPIGFIANNLEPAMEYVADIAQVIRLYQQNYPNPSIEISRFVEDIDLDFALDDLAKLLASMQLGTERIREISMSLRNFSRSDTKCLMPVNIHQGLDSTLLILKHRLKENEYRQAISVVRNYGNLPEITCYPGQINQVFMNLLSNAIDALDEGSQSNQVVTNTNSTHILPISSKSLEPTICISTEYAGGNCATIRIIDNGPGMADTIRDRLFEPLFTTKKVNQGTGLGLSISRQIVVERHGGQLTCQSHPGKGAEFVIDLPINAEVAASQALLVS
ncbi:MAG: hybrid sensor histidine kinase/response regulator [Thainema sp.]